MTPEASEPPVLDAVGRLLAGCIAAARAFAAPGPFPKIDQYLELGGGRRPTSCGSVGGGAWRGRSLPSPRLRCLVISTRRPPISCKAGRGSCHRLGIFRDVRAGLGSGGLVIEARLDPAQRRLCSPPMTRPRLKAGETRAAVPSPCLHLVAASWARPVAVAAADAAAYRGLTEDYSRRAEPLTASNRTAARRGPPVARLQSGATLAFAISP